MKVMISGGTGLIGSHLVRSLTADGHDVTILTRAAPAAALQPRVHYLEWGRAARSHWAGQVAGMDAVISLAGTSISTWPWTAASKQRILSSRLESGTALAQAVQAASPRPAVFIQGSGINYYGTDHAELRVDESLPAGRDFLAQMAARWEDTSAFLVEHGVRRAIIRTSVVLARQGGVLPLMALPVRLFAGGRLGHGRQGISWIHIADQVAAIRVLLEHPDARGPFNLVAPGPVSNAEFMRTLAQVLRRPYWLPAPGFALRAVLGELSVLLLEGLYGVPGGLTRLGFQFRHPELPGALQDLLG